jgi:hypothetical protein
MNKIRAIFRKFLLGWLLREEYNNLKVLIDTFKDTEKRIILKERNLDSKINEVHDRSRKLDILFENLDVSIDHHINKYSRSWAVISLQGQKMDYIKFMDLGNDGVMEIQRFLRQFEIDSNIKLDSFPRADELFGIERGKGKNNRNIKW